MVAAPTLAEGPKEHESLMLLLHYAAIKIEVSPNLILTGYFRVLKRYSSQLRIPDRL